MKAYKGFDKNLKCRGYQFEIGKEFKEDTADLCHKGFHACENPLDVFGYYAPGDGSRYCEVELDEVTVQTGDDTKRCGKVVRIGAELTVTGLCKAHFDYVTARCDPAKSTAGGDREAAAAGYRGSASAGEQGSASAGNWGSASAGEQGSASAGNWGSASAGNWGSASAGEQGSASAGYRGSASAGYRGSASAGEHGVACCKGGRVKGGLGCAICCTELNDDGENIGIAAAIVDGVAIKADTWYTVKNGEFEEVAE